MERGEMEEEEKGRRTDEWSNKKVRRWQKVQRSEFKRGERQRAEKTRVWVVRRDWRDRRLREDIDVVGRQVRERRSENKRELERLLNVHLLLLHHHPPLNISLLLCKSAYNVSCSTSYISK